jgi:peptide/nickel transport system substrate-binding protein
MTRIDRRALFATGSAAALLAAVGVSAEARPARGGHLRAALSGGDRSESLFHVPGGRFLQAVRNAVFESLTETAADGTLQPALAESWEARENGRAWSFRIRQDVFFHDGTRLMSGDVVASLRAFGFDATEGTDVIVDLAEPVPAFPLRLARSGFAVFREHELASGRPVTGTGLYRIRRFDMGRGFLGERVETHRKDGIAGWFDTVEMVAISDERVRAEAVRDGIVDVADLHIAHDLSERGDVRLVPGVDKVSAAVRKGIHHHPRTGLAPLDDMRFAERWWASS